MSARVPGRALLQAGGAGLRNALPPLAAGSVALADRAYPDVLPSRLALGFLASDGPGTRERR